MVRRLLSFSARPFFRFSPSPRKSNRFNCRSWKMGDERLLCSTKKRVNFRLCNVSSYTTELIEIHSDNPSYHVLFIPGNPGCVTFYNNFVESLYDLLGGDVSITAIGHIAFTKKNWERGRLFSLQEQIDHKVDFIRQEMQNIEVPMLLIGHSIGSYISIEIFRKYPEKVAYCISLYPFLALNPQSSKQSLIGKIAASPIICAVISLLVEFFGLLPFGASRYVVTKSLGRSWSASAVDALCTHMLQYHTFRNMLFMAMTEFQKLSETPDWEFVRKTQQNMAFLFGIDDHWGPLEMFKEISKQAPNVDLSIEREGHTHAFCCTEAGSMWVARHVANLMKKKPRIQGQ